MLRCTKCKEEKPETEFHKAHQTTRGYQYDCKPCTLADRGRRYREDPAMRERMKINSRVRNQKFRDENGPAWRAGMLNRKAKKHGLPGRVTIKDLRAKWEQYHGKCALGGVDCEGDAAEWDHAIPVTRAGSTGRISNILPACRSCNAKKNNLTLLEWRRECHYRHGGIQGWIHPTAIIGEPPESREHWGKPGIEPDIHETALVEALVTVDAGIDQATFIGPRVWLGKHVHVGHDCSIGDDTEIAPHCSIGGHVTIGKKVKVGQGAVFKPRVRVGDGAVIGCGAVVVDDVSPHTVVVGNPAKFLKPAYELHLVQQTDEEIWNEWFDKSRGVT